ncbi:MAG: adenosylcobinamide-phosphate synthase CbiB [Gammaproteobacteria bacterium]|nr:adenosylcobinamide-phosphate synthase CbiB [Gammaproteobacteria bacterium]
MTIALLATGAIWLDWLLGEPTRYHPLVGFGKLATALENKIYGAENIRPLTRKIHGSVAVVLLILPLTACAATLTTLPYIGIPASLLLLYLTIGHKSLHDHAKPVAQALKNNDEEAARGLASRMVSRDPSTLNIPAATTESILENGSDSVFATLFWFAIAGIPGAVLHRLVNTLDAMWGYRNQRYNDFGWAAARLDDLMNFLPARLTALTYAIIARSTLAISCWRRQAPLWDSPNAGPVMAAGAGALGISLGGPARYHGEWHSRAQLGDGPTANYKDIERALKLVSNGVILWLFIISLFSAYLAISV